MNKNLSRALEYIKNTGGNPKIEWFDTDNAPIGQLLRNELKKENLIYEKDRKIFLVNKPTTKNN